MPISDLIGAFILTFIASRLLVSPALIQRIGPAHNAVNATIAAAGAGVVYLNHQRDWGLDLPTLFWVFIAANLITRFLIGWWLEKRLGWNGPFVSLAIAGLYLATALDDPLRIIRDGLVVLIILGFPAFVLNYSYNQEKEKREKAQEMDRYDA